MGEAHGSNWRGRAEEAAEQKACQRRNLVRGSGDGGRYSPRCGALKEHRRQRSRSNPELGDACQNRNHLVGGEVGFYYG